MPEDMPDHMPEDMPDRMSNRMSEDMSDMNARRFASKKMYKCHVGDHTK